MTAFNLGELIEILIVPFHRIIGNTTYGGTG